MRAIDILEKALLLLGYQRDDFIMQRSIVIINTVYAELFFCFFESDFKPIESLDNSINLPEKALLNIFPYGVAALLAAAMEDASLQGVFSNIYNQRLALLSSKTAVKDVLPRVGE